LSNFIFLNESLINLLYLPYIVQFDWSKKILCCKFLEIHKEQLDNKNLRFCLLALQLCIRVLLQSSLFVMPFKLLPILLDEFSESESKNEKTCQILRFHVPSWLSHILVYLFYFN